MSAKHQDKNKGQTLTSDGDLASDWSGLSSQLASDWSEAGPAAGQLRVTWILYLRSAIPRLGDTGEGGKSLYSCSSHSVPLSHL